MGRGAGESMLEILQQMRNFLSLHSLLYFSDSNQLPAEGGRGLSPQECPHPGLRACGCAAFRAKRNCAVAIKLRTLRWGDSPGLSGQAQCNHTGPNNRVAGGSEAGKGGSVPEGENVTCSGLGAKE